MSILSAREKLYTLRDPKGYCLPLTIDACLKNTDLPNEFYDLCKSEDQKLSFNSVVSTILRKFFGVEPMPDTDNAPIATYHAFGASPQRYMPDVGYDFSDELTDEWKEQGITNKQLRIRELIAKAAERRCIVMFHSKNNAGHHISGLDFVDPDFSRHTAQFLIRDYTTIVNGRVYDIHQLTGISGTPPGDGTRYVPLPEVTKDYFPAGATSPFLTILPGEPLA